VAGVNAPSAPRVFCSYRSTDRAVVEAFAERLRARGVDAWLDVWEVGAGDDVVARMDEGVDRCEAALVFLSRAWFDGDWVIDEYTSLALRRVEDRIRVIPVIVDDVEVKRLPARLRKLARRCVEDFDAICDTLLGVDHKPGLSAALAAAVVAVGIAIEQHQDRGAIATMTVDGAVISAPVGVPAAGLGLERARSDALLVQLGQRLARVVFPGEIATALQEHVDALGAGSVIDLRFRASGELMSLAFEAVRLPGGAAPALLSAVRVSRSELGLEGPVVSAAPGPLKILVAVGAPDEGQTRNAALDVEAEMGLIVDSVRPAVEDDRARVRILEVGDLTGIRAALARRLSRAASVRAWRRGHDRAWR